MCTLLYFIMFKNLLYRVAAVLETLFLMILRHTFFF